MVGWGAVMTAMGFVGRGPLSGYAGLLITRLLLGVFEAGE